MSIKRILVPLTGKSVDDIPLQTALGFTKLFNGHLEALHLRPDVQGRLAEISHGEGANLDERLIREVLDAAEVRAERARGAFERLMQQHSINLGDDPTKSPSASWREAVDGADVLARDGGFIDLIVIGRPVPNNRSASTMLDTALFTSGHPVLIAPSVAPNRFAERVLIGWNRTVQSERAIARALPFLEQAQQVVLLAVETGAKLGPTASEAASYLSWHGVVAAVKQVETSERHVGEVLLDEASAMEADLLVMGAYSHSRLREMILGGVTRYVLNHAELPILMAH